MFDLPEPFGPTITDTPGANSSFVRCGKDLKPFMEIDFRCISAASRRASRARSGGFLLGALLGLSLPAAELLPGDLGDRDEAAVVRRALLGLDPVV